MRILVALLVFISGLSNPGFAQQDDLKVGMSMDEFRKVMPGILPDEVKYNNTINEKVDGYGLNGNWTYRFKNNQLVYANFLAQSKRLGVGFSDYSKEKTTAEFQQFSKAMDLLIKDYLTFYGIPSSVDKNDPEFVDPETRSYSYDIRKYIWTQGENSILVRFSFHGNTPPDEKVEYIENSEGPSYYYTIQIDHVPIDASKEMPIPKESNGGDFQLGVTATQFAKNRPDLFPEGLKINGQWRKEEKWFSLKGDWHYDFEQGKLDWFSFSYYVQDGNQLNKKNFEECLSATRKIIAHYEEILGKPTKLENGETKFIDPAVKRHWGYDVINANWNDKVEVEFQFFGGKGQYFFLVKVEHH
jgi:hypothetical protein